MPESVKPSFTAENPDVRKKIVEIKEQIRKSGCEVFDDYPCHWGGVVDGKPMVTGLEQFGSRVLNNLWTAITREFPDEVRQLCTGQTNRHTDRLTDAQADRQRQLYV